MTKFKSGQSGNPAGRPAGSPNKLNQNIRKTLDAVITDELEQVPALLEELDAKDRLEILTKLVSFVLPKLRAVESIIEVQERDLSKPLTIKDCEAELKERGLPIPVLGVEDI